MVVTVSRPRHPRGLDHHQPPDPLPHETMPIVKQRTAILASVILTAVIGSYLARFAESTEPKLPKPTDRWIEVKTANFTLFSNAGEKMIRLAGSNLEQLRAVLQTLFGGMEFSSPVPTAIFVFDDPRSFAPYGLTYEGKVKELGGYFSAGPLSNHVAIVGNQYSTDVSSTIYHEYLHYLLRTNQTELPLWLNEGLAEFYSTFDVEDGLASIGTPISNHLRWLRNNSLIPLAELIAMDNDSPEYNEGHRRGVFYAQSWALTHMMVMDSSEGPNRASVYAGLLRRGIDGDDAFQDALGGSYVEIEKELNRYVRSKEFSYSQVPVDFDVVDSSTVVEMSRPEVLSRLGNLLIALGPDRADFAAEHFQAALAADPDYGPAMTGLGLLDELADSDGSALARYENAAALAPDDFLTQFLLGRALYTRFSGSTSAEKTAELVAGARSALGRAVALQPSFAEAWAMLGTTYTWDDHPDDAGIEAMERACRLLPERGDLGYNLVLLHVRRNQRDDAFEVVDRMRKAGVDEHFVNAAQDLTLEFEMRRADALLGEEKIDEAMAVLEAVNNTTTDPNRKRRVDDEIRRIKDSAATGAFNETYNEAVQLINAGSTGDGIALLDALVDEASGPGQAATARDLLDRTRAYVAYREQTDRAVALANSGDIDAAIEILEPLVARAPDSIQAAEVRSFIDKLHRYRDFQGRYNRTVDLVNAGDFEAAIAVLEPLVGAAPTPQLNTMAELLLKELEDMR